jgi:hypothetical protein
MTIRSLTVALMLMIPASAAASPVVSELEQVNGPSINFPFESGIWDDSSVACSMCERFGNDYTAFGDWAGTGGGFVFDRSTVDVPWWWDKSLRQTGKFWFYGAGTQSPTEPVDSPQPVPEPSTLLLIGSSMALAAARKAHAARKARRLTPSTAL